MHGTLTPMRVPLNYDVATLSLQTSGSVLLLDTGAFNTASVSISLPNGHDATGLLSLTTGEFSTNLVPVSSSQVGSKTMVVFSASDIGRYIGLSYDSSGGGLGVTATIRVTLK